MMKVGSKRRRTKVEIEEERLEERMRQEGRDRQAQQMRELTTRLQQMEQANANNAAAADILSAWI